MRNEAAAILLLLGLTAFVAPPVHGEQLMVDGGVESAVRALGETAVPDTAFRPVHDAWIGFDKVQHTTFSLLWVLGNQYLLVNKAGWNETDALPLSIGVTAALGLAKELYDWRISPYRYFSGRDLVADVVGIAAGILLVVI